MMLHPDTLFPAESTIRSVARLLYQQVKDLPIVSPHGHTDPQWFANNPPFDNPVDLFIKPDHYLYRMLYSQGIPLERLGIAGKKSQVVETNNRNIWRLFCQHYYLFRGTPSRFWLDHSLYEICGMTKSINEKNADALYDALLERFAEDDFRPRQLLDKLNIQYLATTDSPIDDLAHQQKINQTDLKNRVICTYRPDPVVDPQYDDFSSNLQQFATMTNSDISSFNAYLDAHRKRRQVFIEMGATATDHGHPSAQTADLSATAAEKLYQCILSGNFTAEQAELFRAQMLTEMAKMSLEDGLVMQIHAGSYRNHNRYLFENFGRDRGADIPMPTDFVHGLKPLLDRLGNESALSIILFTLDESTYTRELAPLAGHYPALKIGPSWWFFDSIEGMRRYKEAVIETAGFYNTVGFNDDTRAFLSIPARHDMSRRIDCGYLARLVCEHRISEQEALLLATELSGELAKKSYKLS